MNNEFLEVIKQYQSAVASMFPKLVSHLGVKTPISNSDWASLSLGRVGRTSCGMKYRKHGYGVEMNDGTISVDFDLGEEGQIDGIDVWKLAEFIENNNIESDLTGKGIEKAIKEAVADGDMEYSGYLLYYLT